MNIYRILRSLYFQKFVEEIIFRTLHLKLFYERKQQVISVYEKISIKSYL